MHTSIVFENHNVSYRCMSLFIVVASKKISEKPQQEREEERKTEIKTSGYRGSTSHYRIWRLLQTDAC